MLAHACVTELSSRPCIPLLCLICALFKGNQTESRLCEDLALTHSKTHIHHFPVTFVLHYFMLLFKKLLIFLILSLFDFLA